MTDLKLDEFCSKCEQTIGFKLVCMQEYDNAPALRFLDQHIFDMFNNLALLYLEIGRAFSVKCVVRTMSLTDSALEKIVETSITNSADMRLLLKREMVTADSLDELFSKLKPRLEELAYMITAALKIEKMPAVCKLRNEFETFKTRQKALNAKIAKMYVLKNEAAASC